MDKKVAKSFYSRLNKSMGGNVRPSLVLSKAARTTPFKTPWLNELRDFICRTGAWRNHPIDSVELFAASPAPGAEDMEGRPNVIGPNQPVFTSLGFGAKGVRNGRVEYDTGVCAELRLPSSCDALICIANSSNLDNRPPCNVLDRSGGRIALSNARPTSPQCLVLDPPEQSEPEGPDVPISPQCLVLDPPEQSEPEGTGVPISPQCLALDPPEQSGSEGAGAPVSPQCLALDPLGRASTCYDSYCGGDTCLEENCSSHKCSTNACGSQFCGDHLCGTKGSCDTKAAAASTAIGGGWLGEFAANAEHPFVQELITYFGAQDQKKLEASVLKYIGRNMFGKFSKD